MKHLIRYKLKADRVAENESLVRAVYKALETTKPPGVHYATFRLDDGVSFMHLVSYDHAGAGEALTSLPAFRAFSAEVKDRCAELPVKTELTEIGSYGFFDT